MVGALFAPVTARPAQVEPALPAGCGGTAVPGDGERLQASAGERQQVLLQWMDAEHVGNAVRLKFAVGSFRFHPVAAIATEKPRGGALMPEMAAIESAEHGCLGNRLHRQIVVRATPSLVLRRVAPGAGIRSDPSLGFLLPGIAASAAAAPTSRKTAQPARCRPTQVKSGRKHGGPQGDTSPQPPRPAFRSSRCGTRAS